MLCQNNKIILEVLIWRLLGLIWIETRRVALTRECSITSDFVSQLLRALGSQSRHERDPVLNGRRTFSFVDPSSSSLKIQLDDVRQRIVSVYRKILTNTRRSHVVTWRY